MIAELPTSLGYLAPAIQALRAQGDFWSDDCDPSVLQEALMNRIDGQTPQRAQATLDHDRETIQQWLAEVQDENSPGHYVVEYLAIPNLANLLFKAARGEDPNAPDDDAVGETAEATVADDGADAGEEHVPPIVMDTPKGWTRIPAEEELFMRNGSQILTVSKANQHLFELLPALWRQAGQDEDDELEMTIADVSFGPSRGFRGVNNLGYCYILRVIGGFVQISIEKNETKVDIRNVEAVFDTIRVVEG